MAISAQMVKQLRELSGAGMMDCKKALEQTNGDIEKAVDILREKGLGKAIKKADRLASEGLIKFDITSDDLKASLCEINSETDFVAKNENFQKLAQEVNIHILNNNFKDVEELQNSSINGSSFSDYLNSQIAKIGENIVVRRFEKLQADENSFISGYVHSNSKVGVLIQAKCDSKESIEKSKELVRNICMHAAAMKPIYLSYTQLDSEFVEKETIALKANITKENEELRRLGKHEKKIPLFGSMLQLSHEVLENAKKEIENTLKEQKKPEKIWDKIIPGQMDRFVADNTQLDQQYTLLSQFFVMDDKKTISQVINEHEEKIGGKLELVKYIRFELGEGLEKKSDDFAAEVAAQMK